MQGFIKDKSIKMKRVLVVVFCLFSFLIVGAQLSVNDKIGSYLKLIPGTGKVVYYDPLLQDTSKMQVAVVFMKPIFSDTARMLLLMRSAGTIILDYALYDSSATYNIIRTGFSLDNIDTFYVSINVMPEQLGRYKRKKEVFSVKQKCELIGNTVFIKQDTVYKQKDTLVFSRYIPDMLDDIHEFSNSLDSLAKFIQVYALRSERKKWVRYEVYNLVGKYVYLYGPNGRMYYKVCQIP